MMSKKKEIVYEPEIVDDENKLPLTNDRKAEVMVDQSWVPFANKMKEINVRSYRKVVQESLGRADEHKEVSGSGPVSGRKVFL